MADDVIIFRDFDADFAIGPDGDIKQVTNIEAIYASISNILLTSTGERVMLRRFPGALQAMLMEPLIGDAMRRNAEAELSSTIQKWDDRIRVNWLDVILDQDTDSLYIKSEFYIQGYENVFTFQQTIK